MRLVKLTIILLAILLMVSGCGTWNPTQTNPENEQFYQGSEGVLMRFVPGSPPPRMFYYANDLTYDNSFDVSVELHNMGASETIGATYISGYSPHIVAIEGVELSTNPIGDCAFGLGGGGSGGLNLNFDCLGINVNFYDNGNMNIRIDEAMSIFGIPLNFVDFSMLNGQWRFNMDMSLLGDNLDLFNHGRMMILALSVLDFRQYNGFPFNGGIGIMKGDNYYYPGGEFGFQDFTAHIYDWPSGLDETRMTFQVDACYGYSTYAAPLICIDPAPFDETDKVCTPHEYTWSGSQGAPVAITSLKQDPTPKGMFLTFTVRNVGGGEVIHLGHLERCSPYYPGRFDGRFKDVVYIGDIRISNQQLTCTPGYEIRLNNGVGTFTCEYRLDFAGSKTAYETPVVVELWYGYHDSIQTQTLIKRAG